MKRLLKRANLENKNVITYLNDSIANQNNMDINDPNLKSLVDQEYQKYLRAFDSISVDLNNLSWGNAGNVSNWINQLTNDIKNYSNDTSVYNGENPITEISTMAQNFTNWFGKNENQQSQVDGSFINSVTHIYNLLCGLPFYNQSGTTQTLTFN